MELEPSIIVALVSLIGTLFCAYLARDKVSKSDAVKLEARLVSIETCIETKLEPIWNTLIKELPKLLISPEHKELDKLVKKAMEDPASLNEEERCDTISGLEEHYLKKRNSNKRFAAMLLIGILKNIKSEL